MTILCQQCGKEFEPPVEIRTGREGQRFEDPLRKVCDDCMWNERPEDDIEIDVGEVEEE